MRGNPFAREDAKPPRTAPGTFVAEAEAAFREFVLRPEFPCVGAKAAFNSDSYTLRTYGELGSSDATRELSAALYAFTREHTQQAPHLGLLAQGEETGAQPKGLDGHEDGPAEEL